MKLAVVASLLASPFLASCRGPAPPAPSGDASAPAASGSAAATGERGTAILAAEHRRTAQEITPADQQSRDVSVRRAAARALSRIGGDPARGGLLRALSDEDDEVVGWAAYGLGFACKGHEQETVAALVARALSRSSAGRIDGRIDASSAIARSVGRCGADASEPTLVAWLGGPRDRAVGAAYGLGDLASSKQKLREETLAALLNLAAGSAAMPPVPEALYPLGRLKHVPTTVIDRIREVASARLAQPGEARIFAVKALEHAGHDGASELGRVLGSPGAFTAAERAEAAKALGRLKAAGQRPLAEALPPLVPSADPVAMTALVGEEFGVLLATLDALDPSAASGPARKALTQLAGLPPPPSAPAAVARRVSWLRCGAAKLLAGDDFRDKLLTACDVTAHAKPGNAAPDAGDVRGQDAGLGAPGHDGGLGKPSSAPVAKRSGASGMRPGSIGARAMVAVLDRGELTGARLAAFRVHARSDDVRAREAALELLKTHDEVEGAAALLTEALLAAESGPAGTAADVIAHRPQRATEVARKAKRARKKKGKLDDEAARPDEGAPSPALIKALLDGLARPGVTDDAELIASLIDATGALALKEAKPRLIELCGSSYPTTREHAAKALGLVGEKRACDAPLDGGPAPDELTRLVREATLSLETDAGALTITLDPTLAPVMVTRVVELARAGYYDGMVVHRVDAGFVTQFGAPFGDGFGGPDGKSPIRCETSPLPFGPLAVGVALSGRDTGSSQLFVMHAAAPHLAGQYPLLGAATGPWAAFADGDVIRRVTVEIAGE